MSDAAGFEAALFTKVDVRSALRHSVIAVATKVTNKAPRQSAPNPDYGEMHVERARATR